MIEIIPNTDPKTSQSRQLLTESIEVRIDKKKAPGLEAGLLGKIQEFLSEEWNTLSQSLNLDLFFKVSVTMRKKTPFGGREFPWMTVHFQGSETGIPVWISPSEPTGLEVLKKTFSEFIMQTRELLVSPLLIKTHYPNWELKSRFSMEEFCLLIKLFVRHGLEIKYMNAISGESNQYDISSIFEQGLDVSGANSLTLFLPPSVKSRSLKKAAEEFSDKILSTFSYQTGIPIPDFRILIDKGLMENQYQFQIHSLKWPPQNGKPIENIPSILQFLKSQAACFIRFKTSKLQLERLRETHPDLIDIVFRKVDIYFLLQLLRQLAWEKIPIRNLVFILETFLEEERNIVINTPSCFHLLPYQWGANHLNAKIQYKKYDPFIIKERIRSRLCREVFNTFKSLTGTLEVIVLGEEMEELLFDKGTEAMLILKVDLFNKLISFMPERMTFILMVAPELRIFLQDSLAHIFPNLHVLSFLEIPPNGQIVNLENENNK